MRENHLSKVVHLVTQLLGEVAGNKRERTSYTGIQTKGGNTQSYCETSFKGSFLNIHVRFVFTFNNILLPFHYHT